MTFQEFWDSKKHLSGTFTLEQLVMIGWVGHRMHGTALDSPPLEENMLEDKKDDLTSGQDVQD